MIIQDGKIISDKDSKIINIKTEDYSVYYKGLIFVAGKKCGEESIQYIIESLLLHDNLRFDKIFGNYFIYFINYKNNEQFIFTDNSGMLKAYKYKNCISTSFLELIDYFDDITIDNLDYDSVTEFFHFGFTYFNSTLIKGIERISANDFYTYKDKFTQHKEKKLTPISSPPQIKIENYFSDLIYAVEEKKISVDITGGFDSRLILSFFSKKKAEFELAISGQFNNRDINLGRKIASKVKRNFYPTFHSSEHTTIDELHQIFAMSDSQIDIVEYHRNNQFNQDRQSRGMEIQISGNGGELYKDFWWLQDFPFYNKAKTNLEKLYNYRIEALAFPHAMLGKKLTKNSLALKERTITKLKSYVLDTNTQSYDNIYYNYKMKADAGIYISIANNYFTSYAPLLELELVKVGYSLKRKERFFNSFHKKWISKNCPEISRIKTTEGSTSSSSVIINIFDIFFYFVDKLKRLSKQILRKTLNKTYLQETPTDNHIYNFWQSHDFFKNSIKSLKEHEILADNIDCEKIPQRFIGKIITLSLLIEKLNK
jgi:hypothetical protein